MTEATTITSRVLKTEYINWRSLKFLQSDSFKEFTTEEERKLKASIIANCFTQPFYVWLNPADNQIYCLDGKHRSNVLLAMEDEGVYIPELLPATFIDCASQQEAAKLVLQYSSSYARVTQTGFLEFVESYSINLPDVLDVISIPDLDLFELSASSDNGNIVAASLQDKFIVPPFSILDTRQGYWQDRKKAWHALGIASQETREDIELIARSGQSTGIYELRNRMRTILKRDPSWDEILEEANKRGMHIYSGASVFDPVLCEVLYTWFCPPSGRVLDPFAGGSVRGIVAGKLGNDYFGIDLREDQCQANAVQWRKFNDKRVSVQWETGDSNLKLDEIRGDYDFVFSCPPYHDLEQYSEDPADLSTMEYCDFIEKYRSIIFKSVSKLKDNRFACFVVGDIRDKQGYYRDFVGDTVQAFEDAGMRLYNEIILVNVAGSLPIRIGKQFARYRKVGKTHQNVLVFYKGDVKMIKEEFPEIEVQEIEAQALDN
jgi:hypothetical protein